MTDSEGRQGGSTSLLTVSESDDSSCTNGTTPHSTAQASTQTSTPSATAALQAATSGVKPGEIAGSVVGGLTLVGIIVLLLVCGLRRRRSRGKGELPHMVYPTPVFINNGGPSRVSRMRSSLMPTGRRRTQPPVDLLPSQARPRLLSSPYYPSSSTLPPRDEYEPNPYVLPSEASARDGHSDQMGPRSDLRYSQWSGLYTEASNPRSRSLSRSDGEPPLSPGSNLSTNPYGQQNARHIRRPSVPFSVASGKASMAGNTHSVPRLILHTDADDLSTVDDNEPVIELPPQYTDRRPPSDVPTVEKERKPPSEHP